MAAFGVLEAACAAIVVGYWAARLRAAPADERASLAARAGWLAAAAFVGEDSVIRAYGFYAYDASWSAFLDRVPLLIVLIWPVVIDSAWALAERLAEGARVAPLVGLIVLADASLIEPVAVHAGLWRWTEPGVFAVPPIGILGWSIFATSAVALARFAPPLALLAAVPTHALLVGLWWAGFRWVSSAVPSVAVAVAAWVVALSATVALVRGRFRERVPPSVLLRRVPAAGFFFVLLAAAAPRDAVLAVYAVAFAPPYLALLRTRNRC